MVEEKRGRMRSFASALLVVAAVLLAGTAACGAWLAQHVVSGPGFASLAQPLGEDQAFQAELSAAVADQAGQAATDGLPEGMASFVEPIVERIVSGIQQDPGYPDAWTATLENSHAETFDTGVPTLDIGPLLNLATAGIAGEMGTEAPDAGPRPIVVSNTDRSAELANLTRFAESWPLFTAAAALALLLGLLAARRRSTTLALAGLGAVALGVVLWLAAGALPGLAEGRLPANPVASTFISALAPRAAENFQGWLVPLMLGAAALAVVGLIFRLVAGSRRQVR